MENRFFSPSFRIGNRNLKKKVFPTKVGKELTKESWGKVGNKNSGSCLVRNYKQSKKKVALK